MKKRVNISIDEELHDWVVKHHGEGYFSKWISDQLIAFSSSIDYAENCFSIEQVENELEMLMYRTPAPKREEESLKKNLGWDKDEWFKTLDTRAIELFQKYENSEDGYPLNFDPSTEAKIKKINSYLMDQDDDLSRKNIRYELKSLIDPVIENLVKTLVDVLMEKTSKDVTREVMLEKLTTSTKEKRAQKELK